MFLFLVQDSVVMYVMYMAYVRCTSCTGGLGRTSSDFFFHFFSWGYQHRSIFGDVNKTYSDFKNNGDNHASVQKHSRKIAETVTNGTK